MKLVVAIDSPKSAETIIEHLLSSHYGSDTEIHLVHVLVPPDFADVSVPGFPDVVAEENQQEQKLLADTARRLREKLNATVTTAILTGQIDDGVAEICKRIGADEAIVASHGRSGLSRLWFGSMADAIVDKSPCAVLVLKMPPQAVR